MAILCFLAAFIDSSSLIDPPGWTIAVIPAAAAASTTSGNGNIASEASTLPVLFSPAFSIAILVLIIRLG